MNIVRAYIHLLIATIDYNYMKRIKATPIQYLP